MQRSAQRPPTNLPFDELDEYTLVQSSGQLGKLVEKSVKEFRALGWPAFIHRSCLHSEIACLPHPAASLLDALRHTGAPVQCSTPDWTPTQLHDAFTRGSHQSANHYLGFLEEEMAVMNQ